MADVTAEREDHHHRPLDQIAVIELSPVVGAHVDYTLGSGDLASELLDQ